ncbi:FtsX-like permease family protein [Nocardioides sp. MAHUQ-72]|uniref:FtsX-like permease family protein n=1 Tax=unclassified Nocardioides TaxID=2615069 RepID=UPI003607FF74
MSGRLWRGLAGWRLALRLARRDALRSKGRSILVLVMIALPVLAVTAADVVMKTSDVSGAESLDRRLGAADARVSFERGTSSVLQAFDPDEASTGAGGRSEDLTGSGLARLRSVLGPDVRAIPLLAGGVTVDTDRGAVYADVTGVDLADPLARGLFDVSSGRVPRGTDEVVVNTALADHGFALGDRLELQGGGSFTVVGIGESATYRDYPVLVGATRDLAAPAPGFRTWLVGGADVSWEQVKQINAVGGLVLSRAVLLDPPPDSEIPAEIRSWSGGPDEAVIAVTVLVVVMALIEVVLLAGPAFAVGARRQSRSLALMAAAGGTPPQARRVVLAGGVVLGGVAAVLGVVLGIGAAWLVMPVVQRYSNMWFGPFDVPWLHLLGIAAFGLVSALLAAVVPAWIASRQDVVAVLAGRRGDRAASRRSPVLGAVLLGLGVAGAAFGARSTQSGEFLIAGSAILAVLGMILLVPMVVVAVARLSRRLPLTVRYAVRDAARHRTRTVPAVAAVAATVAGVVALGIANTSDDAQNRAQYTPQLEPGHASLTQWGDQAGWPALRAAVERYVPDADITEVRGIPSSTPGGRQIDISLRAGRDADLLDTWGGTLGSSVLVSDDGLPIPVPGVDGADLTRADTALRSGKTVVFTSREVTGDEVTLVGSTYPLDGGRAERLGRVDAPAVFVPVAEGRGTLQAVVPSSVPEAFGSPLVAPRTVGLMVGGAEISEQQQADVEEAVAGISGDAGFYVERGYQTPDETVILLLVLGALGAVLMLGGTLTATFLALSDARPDLATLAAVGASPRTRRGVAAAYALVVGLVGAALGTAVGFIPGVAITYPLTGNQWVSTAADGTALPDHFLDVPWLLIGALVVVLPLLTALVVGVSTRSRLPLVARLD